MDNDLQKAKNKGYEALLYAILISKDEWDKQRKTVMASLRRRHDMLNGEKSQEELLKEYRREK